MSGIIKYGGTSFNILTYASFMRKEKKFTCAEVRQFFPHKFRKTSDITRACVSLAENGYLVRVGDGWHITDKGYVLLAKISSNVVRQDRKSLV